MVLMTKQEKLHELTVEFDNLVDELLTATGRDRIEIIIHREIVSAQITALNWRFDND